MALVNDESRDLGSIEAALLESEGALWSKLVLSEGSEEVVAALKARFTTLAVPAHIIMVCGIVPMT